MAPTIRIPDGFVFVPRAHGVALRLLEAAGRIGVDQKVSVRTVQGGFHVTLAVADEYQGGFSAVVADEPDEIEQAVEPEATAEPSDQPVEPSGEPTPGLDWTVAEIDAWAAGHGITFPATVTKKAAKVDFINETVQQSDNHEEEQENG